MYLSLLDIFKDLEGGELSQFSFSGSIDGDGSIPVSMYPRLIRHVNKALTALHTRFALKEEEVFIQLEDHITLYVLETSNQSLEPLTDPASKYIINPVTKPYTGDLIRINSIFDELGNKFPINDETFDNSLYLPNYKTVQVPYPLGVLSISVLYRANHAMIDDSITNPEEVLIDIPAYCVEPLLTYIASRVYGSSPDQTKQALSANLLSKYELQCKELEDKNVLHNTVNTTNTKVRQGGWV